MRLGFTIQEAYLILLVGLSLLAAVGTAYGSWALKRAKAATGSLPSTPAPAWPGG